MEQMEYQTSSALDDLKALSAQICNQRAHGGSNIDISSWQASVDKLLSCVSQFTGDAIKTFESQLETVAVTLWNYAVAMKSKDASAMLYKTKLRHVACSLAVQCSGSHSESSDDTPIRRQTMMCLKTARAWLATFIKRIDKFWNSTQATYCENAEMAMSVLQSAAISIDKLHSIIISRRNAAGGGGDADVHGLDAQRIEVEHDRFKMLCYKAEAALSQSQHQIAMDCLLTAKEMLSMLPKECSFLSMMCYNFGVDLYRKKRFEDTVAWLRESFDLGKRNSSIGAKNQARTLRLLANAYLELDPKQHLQTALNVVSLAISEHLHPAGLFLKLRILVISDENGQALGAAVQDILKHADFSLDMGLSVVGLLIKHKRRKEAEVVLTHLEKQFENSPDVGQVLCTHLEVLCETDQVEKTRCFIEQCITAHNTGRPMDGDTKKRFHILIWEKAAVCFEEHQFSEAVDWYNYSLSLYGASDLMDKNLAKLQRNRASCYLSLEKFDKAEKALHESERCDSTSPYTHFISYKLALALADTDKAIKSLKAMCEHISNCTTTVVCDPSASPKNALLCVAAQMALEKQHQEVVITALECLIQHGQDICQTITALRCLIRVRLVFVEQNTQQHKSREISNVITLMKTACEKLKGLSASNGQVKVENEAGWFAKIAWNLALQCEQLPEELRDLFKLCYQFSVMCLSEPANLTRQKTCLMMAAAGGLNVARALSDIIEKRCVLGDVLDDILACRAICDQIIDNQSIVIDPRKREGTDLLLLLYEFEARAKLGEPQVEGLLEQALSMPNSLPKTFEAIAALAMEPPACHRTLSIRALKAAIRKHLQTSPTDFSKLSKAFHSLIQMSLIGSRDDTGNGKEEAYSYYTEVLDVINVKAQGEYPEMEVLWLMTKAWNCGIQFYSSGHYDTAEKWCAISLRFLKHLATLKNTYEEQMNTVYSDVLAKLEGSNNKSQTGLEE